MDRTYIEEGKFKVEMKYKKKYVDVYNLSMITLIIREETLTEAKKCSFMKAHTQTTLLNFVPTSSYTVDTYSFITSQSNFSSFFFLFK